MQIQQDQSKSNSAVQKFFYDCKISLFYIVFQMLKGEPLGIFIRIILLAIELLQVMSFAFRDELIQNWRSYGNEKYIQQITGAFMITQYFKDLDFQQFMVIFFSIVGILCLLILDIIFILFQISRKGNLISWSLAFLQYSTEFICSILYLPIFDLFMSVYKCNYGTGNTVTHVYFTDVQCYTGNHFITSFVAGFLGLLLFFYTGIMILLFYESRQNNYKKIIISNISKDCNHKYDSQGEFKLFLFKTILVITYTFIYQIQFEIILVVIFSAGSIILFNHYQFNLNHYNYWIAKLITIQHASLVWTSLILILSFLTYNYNYDHSIYIWIFGLIFVIIFLLFRLELRQDLILIDTNNYLVQQQPLIQLPYLTKMLILYPRDKTIQIMLDGFLDYHRKSCKSIDCPGKRRAVKTTKFSKMMRQEGENEQIISLISVTQKLYYQALQKFPYNTTLRMRYSFFLLDNMKSKQQALQEFMNAEQENPKFTEQFIIYRNKILIENDLMDSDTSKKGDNLELVNELSIQNHIDSCRKQIEINSNLHAEFWAQLQEDHPDLGRLSEIGYKISVVTKQAEDQWNKLLRISSFASSIIRLYARYTRDILNDEDEYEILMQKLLYYTIMNSRNKNKGMIDISTESRPTIVISAEEDYYGQITNANLIAVGLLGYEKNEIINRNIKSIMPQLYSKKHDSFLNNYLATLEPRILGIDRNLPALTKQDYMLIIIVFVRHIPSLIHGIQFIGQFTLDKTLKQIVYILIDTSGKIESISSSCINTLKLDTKCIEKRVHNIEEFIPGFLENIDEYKSRRGGVTQFQPRGKVYNQFNIQQKKQVLRDCLIHVEEVTFKKFGLQGYIIRMEVLKQHSNIVSEAKILELKTQYKKQIQHLELVFYYNTMSYIGEFRQGCYQFEIQQTEDNCTLQNTLNFTTDAQNITHYDTIPNHTEQYEDKIKYHKSNDIRTVKLIGDKLIDLEEFRKEEEEVEEELEMHLKNEEDVELFKKNNGFNDNLINESGQNVNNIFKTRKSFQKFILDSNFLNLKEIINLKIVAIIFILIFLSICLINHFVISNELSESTQRYNDIQNNNLLISSGQRILMKILDLNLVYLGYYNNVIIDKNLFQNISINEIGQSLQKMIDLQNQLQSNTLNISEVHKNLVYKNSVPIKFFDQNREIFRKFDINEATQQIISKITNLIYQNISQFQQNNSDFQFIQYNLLNDYYISLVQISQEQIFELFDWSSNKQVVFDNLIILCVLPIVIALIILFYFNLMVKQSQKEVLILFLDIPHQKVRFLFSQCENFLISIQNGEEDVIQKQSFHKLNKDDDEVVGLLRQKRKNYKMDLKINKNFFLPFTICSLILLAYVLLTHFITKNSADNISQFVQELNYTARADGFFFYSNNALRQMMIDNKYTINDGLANDYIIYAIDEMANINSLIQKEHSINLINHDQKFNEVYDQIFINDPCGIIFQLKIQNENICMEFAQNEISKGLSVAVSRYIKEYRNIYLQYSEILQQLNNKIIDQNNFQKKSINLLSQNSTLEIIQFQDIYIQNLYQHLTEQLKNSVSSELDNTFALKVTLLIVAIIVQITVYLFFWIPVIQNVQKDIQKVRMMIIMIPLDVCSSVKSLRMFIFSYYTNNIIDA